MVERVYMITATQETALKSLGFKPSQIKAINASGIDWAKLIDMLMMLLKLFSK